MLEEERATGGRTERALTVFLAGAECPFTCSFCDLWRWTLDGPTPAGALPAQLDTVLHALEEPLPQRIKLYNASNFFDPRAVPPDDIPAIGQMVSAFAAVTVESHANTVGALTREFARHLRGRLEVAMGLETIHPVAMRHLNKRLNLSRFDRAAHFLAAHDMDLRVFVLLGAPYVQRDDSVEWAVRTVEYAAQRGARVVSIIPVRSGNGEIDRLEALGDFSAPTLAQLEAALEGSMAFAPSIVTADLWDVERLSACSACREKRVHRLRRMNLTGAAEPRVDCEVCAT